jgi:hypothetical protein
MTIKKVRHGKRVVDNGAVGDTETIREQTAANRNELATEESTSCIGGNRANISFFWLATLPPSSGP